MQIARVLRSIQGLCLALFLLGTLFRMLHFENANTLLNTGVFGTALSLMASVNFDKSVVRKPGNILLILLLLLTYIHSNHILSIWYWISFLRVGILLYLAYLVIQDPDKILNTISKVLISMALIITLIAILFKILHWPGADIQLIIGFSLGCLASIYHYSRAVSMQ